MFDRLFVRFFGGGLFFLIGAGVSEADVYGEQSLRGNLGVEPYFRTEDGREGQRYSEAEINRYRLYDFYRRQADHHREIAAVDGEILLPYPGLDGGRRGHWGVTNEKRVGALERKEEPEWPRVMMRGGRGVLYVNQGGWMAFDTVRGGLQKVLADVRMGVAEHPFGFGVDRFGNRLDVEGRVVLEGAEDEWRAGGEAAVWFGGYRVSGGEILLDWEMGGAVLSEISKVLRTEDGRQVGISRVFRVDGDVEGEVAFHLPGPEGGWKGEVRVEVVELGEGLRMVRQEGGGVAARHVISAGESGGVMGVSGRVMEWSGLRSGSVVQVLSWCGGLADVVGVEKWLEGEARKGDGGVSKEEGELMYGKEVMVRGVLNADPAASGSGYEIDDVPVPFDHPERTPMTLSGLAFDERGVGYACTLVGDVWRITGLHGDLTDVRWKRFAAGLDMPMGIEVVDGVPYVNARLHLMRLKDLDDDGEADHYERFSRMPLPNSSEAGRDLRRDGEGRFVFNTPAGIERLSADGRVLERIGQGSRNPLGLGVRKDGLVISDSSEGNLENGTCSLYESDHVENERSVAKRKRMLYLPRGIDNSPGSRVFMEDDRFGPLGRTMLGVSFGNGGWYSVVRDVSNGTVQGMMIPQRGWFASGACRVAVQPLDGQVFVAGLDGWGDYGVAEGCLHRIRFTGKVEIHVVGWKAWRNGIQMDFSGVLDELPAVERIFVQQWNYIDSAKSYGSVEVSARDEEKIGHDRLRVTKAVLLPDKRSVFFGIPELHPAMCTQVRATLTGGKGERVEVDVYATLQHLAEDAPWAEPVPGDRPNVLVVPTRDLNGDTNQKLIEHFDRLAGRVTAERAVAADVESRGVELDYGWIRKHLLEPHCLACHGPGTQHDYSTYAGVLPKLRLEDPEASPFYGMVHTGSMPPYPLPLIPGGLKGALLEWIRKGAPE
jgi:hypothetical protein